MPPSAVPDGFGITSVDGLTVVTTPEEIDMTNAELLRAALVAARTSSSAVVVVDMSSTEYCDSTGLNTLVRAQKKVSDDGGELRLVVRTSAVQRMLAVTGVEKLFGVYPTLTGALHGVSS